MPRSTFPKRSLRPLRQPSRCCTRQTAPVRRSDTQVNCRRPRSTLTSRDLAKLLDEQYSTLSVVEDYVEGCYSPMPTLAELTQDLP